MLQELNTLKKRSLWTEIKESLIYKVKIMGFERLIEFGSEKKQNQSSHLGAMI